MRYRLRTLLILLAIGPPLLALLFSVANWLFVSAAEDSIPWPSKTLVESNFDLFEGPASSPVTQLSP
jgi:hypothetical protein